MSARPEDGWKVVKMATELAEQGVEFALATVVWRQAPSSGHQGARAIITSDGEMHGWIGGACAEPVVVREAQAAIAERTPRLILLGTPDHFGEIPDGMTFVRMSCQSEGAMELYIEPVTPSLNLVVVGDSPMAATLVELATVLGWDAGLVGATKVGSSGVNRNSVVIIATQGHGDEEAIERALEADPAFVGLVASKKRGETVLGYLEDRGVAKEKLERVRVPVGLDLGHTSHAEIAVSVLAELVALRARGELGPAPSTTAGEQAQREHHEHHEHQEHHEHHDHAPATAIDPVCGMTVPADETSRPFVYEGTTYYFCAPGCRTAFEKEPTAYLPQETHT